ncbi:MAG: hydrogenase maturation protease [Gaiellaceae bacterium]
MRAAACLGSRYRGDDAVGPLVADRLRSAGAEVLDCDDEPTRLLDAWAGLDLVVIVDAVSSDAAGSVPPGTVHRFDAGDGPLPRELGLASTHAFSVPDALELGRTLGRAPRRVVVIGVEGAAFGMGDPLTPAVAAALDGVAEAVLGELEAG